MSNYRRGGNFNRSNRYNEHDDRDGRKVRFDGPQRGRGGSFKSRPPKKGGYFTNRNARQVGPRSRLEDEDVDMGNDRSGSAASNRRYTPYGDRNSGGSRGGRGGGNKYRRGGGGGGFVGNKDQIMRQLGGVMELIKSDWYKITIPQGKKTEKMVLLKLLAERLTNVSFVPFHYQTQGLNAEFFVNDMETAKQLRAISKKVTSPSGFKLLILVRGCPPPYAPEMTSEITDKLKVAMSNRYDPATRVLNLASLHTDTMLMSEGLYLTISKYQVAKEVISIIDKHIPELVSLNLNDNKLYTLDSFMKLHEKTPNLTKLSLAENALRHERDLEAIKKLEIDELVLDGNPLCDHFKDETSYVSALRKKFPKLMKLDGHALPPPIKVDLDTGSIPPTLGSNFGNDAVKPLICRFCQEYFTIYDSGDRRPLVNAYHDNALFSLSFSNNNLMDRRQTYFTDYQETSRNLLRVYTARRHEKLKTGKQTVIDNLCMLPSTQHDPDSFVLDVSHVSTALLVFTVTGLFKEKDSKREAVRYFSRTFVTIPQGPGIVIVNDIYMLTNATLAQSKNAFKNTLPTPSPGPSAVASPAPHASPLAATPVTSPLSPEMQQRMLAQFSQQSGMNLHWSQICLVQNNWDYDKSAASFTDSKNQNKIPPEAFVK